MLALTQGVYDAKLISSFLKILFIQISDANKRRTTPRQLQVFLTLVFNCLLFHFALSLVSDVVIKYALRGERNVKQGENYLLS